MRIEKCKLCNYHLESMADCAMCRFNLETEYKAVYRGDVLSCPMESALRK